MLKTGTAAPDFTLPDQDGKKVTLASLKGKPVVLSFYPRLTRRGNAAVDGDLGLRALRCPSIEIGT